MRKLFLIFLCSFLFIACSTISNNDSVKIGAILPLTGYGAYVGEVSKKGLDLAIDSINKISKRKYEVIYEDSKTLPKDALLSYKKLRQEGIDYFIVVGGPMIMAISPLTKDQDVVLFGCAIDVPEFVDMSNRVFRVYPNAVSQTNVMAQYNKETLNCQRTAIVYINNDHGRVCCEAYKKMYEQLGGEVCLEIGYEVDRTDFKDIINKVILSKTDCVYIAGVGESVAVLTKQYFANPNTADIILTGDMTFGLPNTKHNIGTFVADVYYADVAIERNFENCYKAKYLEIPSSYPGYSFVIPFLLNDAIGDNVDITPTDVINKIVNKPFKTAVGDLIYDEKGESNLELKIFHIEKH